MPGETATVQKISNFDLRERLFDLGLTVNTPVECVLRAPFGGPSAYIMRGALIALRLEDASLISVTRLPCKMTLSHDTDS